MLLICSEERVIFTFKTFVKFTDLTAHPLGPVLVLLLFFLLCFLPLFPQEGQLLPFQYLLSCSSSS